jgi:hypothetical protein
VRASRGWFTNARVRRRALRRRPAAATTQMRLTDVMADEFLPEGERNVMRLDDAGLKAWRAFLARVRVFAAEE